MKQTHTKLPSIALFIGLIATATAGLTGESQAAVGDPLKVLYLWSGVMDDGGPANNGTVTAVQCTSFSGVTETLQFPVKDAAGTLKGANSTINIASSGTVTAVTHPSQAFTANLNLAVTSAVQGTIAVLATSVNIVCTAQVGQASSTAPTGYMLHGARFNPIPGAQE